MGINTNIIHLFREEGFSQQEAYDQVNVLMHKRYRAWYVAHSEIPIWGEEVDAQVMMYLKGCQHQVLGHLNWRCVFSLLFWWSDYTLSPSRPVRFIHAFSFRSSSFIRACDMQKCSKEDDQEGAIC